MNENLFYNGVGLERMGRRWVYGETEVVRGDVERGREGKGGVFWCTGYEKYSRQNWPCMTGYSFEINLIGAETSLLSVRRMHSLDYGRSISKHIFSLNRHTLPEPRSPP